MLLLAVRDDQRAGTVLGHRLARIFIRLVAEVNVRPDRTLMLLPVFIVSVPSKRYIAVLNADATGSLPSIVTV